MRAGTIELWIFCELLYLVLHKHHAPSCIKKLVYLIDERNIASIKTEIDGGYGNLTRFRDLFIYKTE